MTSDDEKKASRKALAKELEDLYAAAVAFDTTMTTAERMAFSRMARSAWLEKGGTDETFRSNFPAEAAEIATRLTGRTEVTCRPGIMSGDPCIDGTRVPALMIVAALRGGHTREEIMIDYPTLPADGIEAVECWAEVTLGPGWLTAKGRPE